MQARIEFEKKVTRAEVVEESVRAWALVKTLRNLPLNQTLEEVRKRHPQFSSSYPIVVRYMVQMNAYSKGAVDKYLKYIEKNPWDTEEKFLVAQAKYAFYIARALNPKITHAEAFKLQSDVIDMLRKESAEFKTTVNTAKERADATEETYKRSRREELTKMARAFPNQFSTKEDRVILPAGLPREIKNVDSDANNANVTDIATDNVTDIATDNAANFTNADDLLS